jgi:hypothetical protein
VKVDECDYAEYAECKTAMMMKLMNAVVNDGVVELNDGDELNDVVDDRFRS